MAPSTHDDTGLNSLSSTRLQALSKIDKELFVSSFVREQKAHTRVYASEGQAVVDSWTHPSPKDKNCPVVQPLQTIGFDTPVLRSRTEKHSDGWRGDIKLQTSRKQHSTLRATVRLTRGDAISDAENVPCSAKKATKKLAKKLKPPKHRRESEEHSDCEHAARLAERRERKRKKREIIQPTADQPSNELPKPKKAKAPPGLALMYGFSATNVGKNRLTVQPPLSIGVFNKGKASVKLQVKPKSSDKGRQSKHFSEHQFLNKTLPTEVTESSSESETASDSQRSSSCRPQSPLPSTRKYSITNRIPSKRNVAKKQKSQSPRNTRVNQSQGVSETDDRGDSDEPLQAPKQRAESEIWDIELEGAELASRTVSSLPETKTKHLHPKQGTVILDAPTFTSAGPAEQLLNEKSRVVDTSNPRDKSVGAAESKSQAPAPPLHPSPSLCPSESASQIGKCGLAESLTVSKYFPICDPDTSVDLKLSGRPVCQEPSANHSEVLQGSIKCLPVNLVADPPPNDDKVSAAPAQSVSSSAWQDVEPDIRLDVEPCNISQVLAMDDEIYETPYYELDLLLPGTTWGSTHDYDGPIQTVLPGLSSCISIQEIEERIHGENDYGDCAEDYIGGETDETWYNFEVDGETDADWYAEPMYLHGYSELDAEVNIYPDDIIEESYSEQDYTSGFVDQVGEGLDLPLSKPSPQDLDNGAPSPLRFFQGRALLMGLEVDGIEPIPTRQTLLHNVEVNVARTLRGHWLPQRL